MQNSPRHVTLVLAVIATAVVAQCALALTGVAHPLKTRSSRVAVSLPPELSIPLAPPASLPSAGQASPPGARAPLGPADAANSIRLARAFARLDYHLDHVAEGAEVPRLVLPEIPGDLARRGTEFRKATFFRLMLPLVLTVNEDIAHDRARLKILIHLRNRGEHLSAENTAWLSDLEQRYDVAPGRHALRELLRRVDRVPPSLALAQAALESGWGTSKLARRHNNLFGHTQEGDDGTVEGMAQFPSPLDSVRAYVHNLNTHRAYAAFRLARAKMGEKPGEKPLDGLSLATMLGAYSETGSGYIADLESLIRNNDLDRLDGAKLSAGPGWPPETAG
jgi:Bax protein